MCYINNCTQQFDCIEKRLKLKYLLYQWIPLFMESKHIYILFLYHRMFVYVAVKCNFIVAVFELEQPSCLIAWVYLNQKLYHTVR